MCCAAVQALYCSSACCQAACTSSSTAAATAAPQQTPPPSDRTAATAAACCAEHAPGGVECGKPWLRLLPEKAVLAGRCLRVRAQAAAAAADAAAVSDGCGQRDSCRQQQQQLPQCQWQELCEQQRELHLGVLRATLLDSLAYHARDSSSAGDDNSSQTGSQQQQTQTEQHIEQLTLASIVSCVHAEAAADRTAPSRAQHGTAGTNSPAAVLKCLQQLVANGIAIKPFLSSGPGDRWGLGLYPVTAAVLNHSCNPNCSVR